MSRRYELRSTKLVSEAFFPKDKELAVDILSEDDEKEDYAEMMSDSDSEMDGDDEIFKPSNDREHQDNSEEDAVGKEAAPTASKRGRTRNRDTGTSRRGRRPSIIHGKDGHRWYTTARQRLQHRRNPPSTFLPGPIGEARNAQTPLESWKLLFDEQLLKNVQLHTNEEIRRFRDSSETEVVSSPTYNDVDLPELMACFGLMYFSGLQKTSKTNLEDLWSYDCGPGLYRATMPLKRFKFLLRMLRFDDKTTRHARRATDKLAPIREIWQKFISNCTKNYTPASYCTIDEQILSFRGRCPFKVYNGSKPDKYGIKIVMLNDSRTFYMYTAEPYVGRVVTEKGESVPSYYIRKLSEPVHGTARNITCDNWFSSVEIFDKMLREHSITMVGTLRKNKREIPSAFRVAGAIQSSKFAFSETQTLVSYTPKKNKIVLVLSTFHRTSEINSETKKPEMIEFYNATKGGTDCYDQMCHEYSTARKTLRWPMRMWMGMLDQGGINAMVLYNYNAANPRLIRRDFLKSLVMGLVEPHLRDRLNIQTLRRDLRLSIENILHIEPSAPPAGKPRAGQKVRCAFCPRAVDRKVKTVCENCNRPACEEHRSIFCEICAARN